jgi:serine/threonine-protein kinase
MTSTLPPGANAENLQRLASLRRAGYIALAIWPSFAIFDWFIVTFIEPGNLSFHLALRGLGLILLGLAVTTVHALRNPSSKLLIAIETFILTSLSALITAQCLEFRGIASPLALGVVTLLLFRGVTLSDNARHAAIPTLTTAATYPVVLLALSNASPLIAEQLRDPEMVASFMLNIAFIFAAATITLVGGHTMWKLRRQVSETRSLGRYQLKQLIGQGGMGEVWSAYHVALRRNVAVKILRPDSNADETAVTRFEREARATAELNHPNTVRVYDYGVTDDGLWYYAMELLEGEDLSSLLKRGAIEPVRAADLILQASRALAEAHKRGIVHRDIKPANLFLCTLGGDADFIKVLDFGLAKLAENANQSQLTQAGMAVGTPSWVSPEVVMGHRADAAADVYALGAVLYALVTGGPPFSGDDMRAVLMAHLRQTPTRPSERLGRPIPAGLEAIIMRCLDKEPSRRYQDAAALGEALNDFIRDPHAAAERPVRAEPRRHRRLRTPSSGNIHSHATRPPERRAHYQSVPQPVAETHAPTYIGEADWDEYLKTRDEDSRAEA